jgi:hypothetical protein
LTFQDPAKTSKRIRGPSAVPCYDKQSILPSNRNSIGPMGEPWQPRNVPNSRIIKFQELKQYLVYLLDNRNFQNQTAIDTKSSFRMNLLGLFEIRHDNASWDVAKTNIVHGHRSRWKMPREAISNGTKMFLFEQNGNSVVLIINFTFHVEMILSFMEREPT